MNLAQRIQSSTCRVFADEKRWEECRIYAKEMAFGEGLHPMKNDFRMHESAQMAAFIYV